MISKSLESTRRWYNANAGKYAEATRKSPSLVECWGFLSFLPKNPKVLDAGCGAGVAAAVMSYTGAEVVAVDISKKLVSEAKKRYFNLNFQVGNFLTLEFPDESFDGVWSHASLVHLETTEEIEKAISEFHRVLRPGGVIHILVKSQTGTEKVITSMGRTFHLYSPSETEVLLSQAGFSVFELDEYLESERTDGGRPDTHWILALARK